MARGADGKARRKEQRKEARNEANRLLEEDTDQKLEQTEDDVPYFEGHNDAIAPVDNSSEDEDEMPKMTLRKTKIKKKKVMAGPPPSSSKGIKKGPLIMLLLMFGTATIPALLFMGDWVGNMIQKHHILGNMGQKLGIGASPKKRVLSFYEKHDPSKIKDVPTILAKHYGDYPKLVKRLERKYQDYGYFLNWEDDEAPYKLAKEKLELTAKFLGKKWQRYAPLPLQTGARNMKHNFGYLYRKGRVIWKKKVWPALEPYLGVPDGGKAQKRKDAQEARNRKNKKGKRSNLEFRDDDEF
eukprot:CAMPEP_0172497716 /NCGR_PEP_ID=MMETSP1066-20121228/104122_1 /TAXON_ID=671091 /ORGANISM="Coscinodiscus wailesii, Strain CCMP2513" /LENGTH=296 /DNA_ID=CAMNT_0013270647 /DNA_START=132 /DNA_END=1022 /DNA_ORIENTATION=+